MGYLSKQEPSSQSVTLTTASDSDSADVVAPLPVHNSTTSANIANLEAASSSSIEPAREDAGFNSTSFMEASWSSSSDQISSPLPSVTPPPRASSTPPRRSASARASMYASTHRNSTFRPVPPPSIYSDSAWRAVHPPLPYVPSGQPFLPMPSLSMRSIPPSPANPGYYSSLSRHNSRRNSRSWKGSSGAGPAPSTVSSRSSSSLGSSMPKSPLSHMRRASEPDVPVLPYSEWVRRRELQQGPSYQWSQREREWERERARESRRLPELWESLAFEQAMQQQHEQLRREELLRKQKSASELSAHSNASSSRRRSWLPELPERYKRHSVAAVDSPPPVPPKVDEVPASARHARHASVGASPSTSATGIATTHAQAGPSTQPSSLGPVPLGPPHRARSIKMHRGAAARLVDVDRGSRSASSRSGDSAGSVSRSSSATRSSGPAAGAPTTTTAAAARTPSLAGPAAARSQMGAGAGTAASAKRKRGSVLVT
ncbi:hypothetical protein BDY21DRAFT_365437 [Lineolata rhizophorae]|uniref:Uncharacterized protein n=1 Tax=Lineolata rhizophorae TaxID=578093 RepID=A0A6A6NW34_9PEZI|nr:hypothetical protein BDY21DRAFT_365437 [Lineolata rhizophorae]